VIKRKPQLLQDEFLSEIVTLFLSDREIRIEYLVLVAHATKPRTRTA
jgi:hypothetical protein